MTVTDSAVVAVRVPEVPVIVTVTVPVVAVLLAAIVRALLVAVGFVPKLAVTPAGSVELDSVTLPVKPFCAVTLIVVIPLVP